MGEKPHSRGPIAAQDVSRYQPQPAPSTVNISKDPRRLPSDDGAPSLLPTSWSSLGFSLPPVQASQAISSVNPTPAHPATQWADQPAGSSAIQLPIEEASKPLLTDAEWMKYVPQEIMARYFSGQAHSAIEERRNRGLRPFFHKCGFDAKGKYGDVMVAIFEDLGLSTLAEIGVMCAQGLELKLMEKLATQYRMPWFPRKCIEARLQEVKEGSKKALEQGVASA